MLNMLKKLLIFIVIIGGVGYVGYIVFVNPSGFTDKEELINSYFTNIQSETVCINHFNSETKDYCENFQNLLEDKTLEITSLVRNQDTYEVTILIGGVETVFDVTFIEIEVTGLKSFLNSTYYKIDLIT